MNKEFSEKLSKCFSSNFILALSSKIIEANTKEEFINMMNREYSKLHKIYTESKDREESLNSLSDMALINSELLKFMS